MDDCSIQIVKEERGWAVSYKIDAGLVCFQRWDIREMKTLDAVIERALRDWSTVIQENTR